MARAISSFIPSTSSGQALHPAFAKAMAGKPSSFLSFLLAAALLATGVHGCEGKMTAEIYPVGLSDFELAEQMAKNIVSPDGKLVADKSGNRLILYDYPDRHEVLRKLLAKVQSPAHNVRIRVAFKDNTETQSDGVSVDGRLRTGPVVIRSGGAPANGSTRIQVTNQRTTFGSNVQQELLVISGGKAKIRIGTDVPYAEWFWTYGLQFGFWAGEVRWKEVGAQMVVEPYVIGSNIRVRLTPEFSYIVDGQTMATAIEKLSTEVIVADGQEIDLGGLPAADKEFYSRFLVGYSHQGEKRSLHITLKPTIESVQAPGAASDGHGNDRNVGAFRKR